MSMAGDLPASGGGGVTPTGKVKAKPCRTIIESAWGITSIPSTGVGSMQFAPVALLGVMPGKPVLYAIYRYICACTPFLCLDRWTHTVERRTVKSYSKKACNPSMHSDGLLAVWPDQILLVTRRL
jgi:hypothetical protein